MSPPQNSTSWVTRAAGHVGGMKTVKGIGGDVGISALFAIGGWLNSDDGPMKDASPATKKLLNAVFGVPMFAKLTVPELVHSWKGRDVPDFVMHGLTAAIGVLGATTNDKEMMQSAAMLAALFAMAGRLEHGVRSTSREALTELEHSIPKNATRRIEVEGGGHDFRPVSTEEIGVGEHLLVRHGETVPVNAEVLEVKALPGSLRPNSGGVHYPTIGSGEKALKSVEIGSHVPQGAIAEGADLIVKATHKSEESLLRLNLKYLKKGENPAKSVHGIKGVVNNIYVPILVAACAAQFLVSYGHQKRRRAEHERRVTEIGQPDHSPQEKEHKESKLQFWKKKKDFNPEDADWERPLKRTAELAIKMAPCAVMASLLVLPFVKNRLASKFGVLVRDDAALEKCKGITHVLTDIRGTLTRDVHEFTGLHLWDGVKGAFEKCGQELEHELLTLIGKAESKSPHSLAESLRKAARERNLNIAVHPEMDKILHDAGKGVVGRLQDGTVLIGNHDMLKSGENIFKERNFRVPQGMIEKAREMGDSSYLYAVTKGDATHWGLATFKDELRPDVVQSLQEMHQKGVKLIAVTGMEEHKAEHYLKQIDPEGKMGIRLYADHSSVRTNGKRAKTEVVEEYSRPGHVVAAIGDAGNDAAFLQRARELGGVSFAIGAGGAELTKGRASMVIEGVHQIPGIMEMSASLNRLLWTNVAAAASWMTFLVGTHVFGMEMKPHKASIAHEAPTFLLTLTSLWESFKLTKKLPSLARH